MSDVYKELGKFIKIKRIEADMTQADVAAKLNISQQAYALYERGKRTVSVDTVVELGSILNFEPGEFFNRYVNKN